MDKLSKVQQENLVNDTRAFVRDIVGKFVGEYGKRSLKSWQLLLEVVEREIEQTPPS